MPSDRQYIRYWMTDFFVTMVTYFKEEISAQKLIDISIKLMRLNVEDLFSFSLGLRPQRNDL